MFDYFFKPSLDNMSQGARLKFVRNLRYKEKKDVAKFFNLGGQKPYETITKYESNKRKPEIPRVKEMASYFKVSYEVIKLYDFNEPIDQVYYHMWEEEQMPYSEFKIDFDALKKSAYNMEVVQALNEWKEMKEKRKNNKIPTYPVYESYD